MNTSHLSIRSRHPSHHWVWDSMARIFNSQAYCLFSGDDDEVRNSSKRFSLDSIWSRGLSSSLISLANARISSEWKTETISVQNKCSKVEPFKKLSLSKFKTFFVNFQTTFKVRPSSNTVWVVVNLSDRLIFASAAAVLRFSSSIRTIVKRFFPLQS